MNPHAEPAIVVTLELGVIMRILQPVQSVTKIKSDELEAIPFGYTKVAAIPFPSALPMVPLPAIVVTVPAGVTRRTR